MKPILPAVRLAVLTLCLNLLVSPGLRAQPAGPPGGGAFFDRMKMFFADLNLTEAQQSQIRDIVTGEAEKLMPLMQDRSLSREDRIKKFQEWGDQIEVKLKPVLTPEQFAKYKEKKDALQKAGPGGTRSLDRTKAALQCTDEEWTVIKPLVEDVLAKQRERYSRSGVQEMQALQQTIANPGASPEEVQRGMEALRAHVRDKDAALKAAREKLRQVLTARQEAAMLLAGILD